MANLKYAVVVKGIGDATLDTTEDFTKSGFGTPKAAIVFISRNTAHDTPTQHAAASIGFWNQADDAQTCTSCFGEYGADPGDTTTLGYNNKVAAIDDINSALQFSATCDDITDGVRLTFSTTPSANYKATVVLLAGSDLQTKVGMTNLGTGTSPIELSCGFQPNIVLTTVANSSDGTHATNYAYFEFGAARDTGAGTEHALMWQWQDAASTMKNNIVTYNDRCGAHSAGWSLTISGWDSNGCDVTPSSSTSSWNMGWLALDTGDAGTWLSAFSPPTTASSDWTFSSVGFKPGLVLGGLALNTALNTVQTTSPAADTSGVFAFDGTYEGCHLIGDDDGASSCYAYTFSGAKMAYLSSMTTTTETNYYDIGHPTFTSSGWSVSDAQVVTADSTTRYWWGLAIEEGDTGLSVSGGTCSIASSIAGTSLAFGSVSRSGGTPTIATSITSPSVSYGSTSAPGGTASIATSITSPSVILGSISRSGGECAIATSISGVTVEIGGATAPGGTCELATSIESVAVEYGDVSVSGASAEIASSLTAGSVLFGSVSVPGGTCEAATSISGVTAEVGGTQVPGGTCSIATSIESVSVEYGSVSASPGEIGVASSIADPSTELGSVSVPGGTCEAAFSIEGVTVLTGGGQVAGGTCEAALSISDPAVAFGSVAVPGGELAVATSIAEPLVEYGSVTIQNLILEAATSISGPVVSGLTICPDRLHSVSAETRIHRLPSDDRVHRLPQQTRIFKLNVNDTL